MSAEAKHAEKLVARSNLEQAVRDFVKAAEACGDGLEDITDELADVVYDGSDEQIQFETER